MDYAWILARLEMNSVWVSDGFCLDSTLADSVHMVINGEVWGVGPCDPPNWEIVFRVACS